MSRLTVWNANTNEQVMVTEDPDRIAAELKTAGVRFERWPVAEERLERLLANGQITVEQAQKFREQGAIGSHLENLERNQGFKGFNQKGVSEIFSRVDPRKQSM